MIDMPYHIYLKPPEKKQGIHTIGSSFIILDNPGYDEYDCGTGAIKRAARHTQLITSAYVFVITFDNYTKSESSKQLKLLYSQNKGNTLACGNITTIPLMFSK